MGKLWHAVKSAAGLVLYRFLKPVGTSIVSTDTTQLESQLDARLTSLSLLSGAHKSLLQPEGLTAYQNYTVFCYIKSSAHARLPGGDFFRIKEIPGGGLLVVAGDVISHGENVFPGAFACLVVFLALREKDPVEILKAMNRGLYDIGRENGGEALSLAMWLQADGTILYAGGIDRLFVQRNSGGLDELPTHRVIIGKQDIELTPLSAVLAPGDNLIVASDGVIYGDLRDDQVSAMITYTPGRS